jgi:ubiquinone/menaquinone biosynthesis C-methylase UbiE
MKIFDPIALERSRSIIQKAKAWFRLNRMFLRARYGAQLHELFGDVENEFWFWMNTEGLRFSTRLRQFLPSMPDETIQCNFTGAAGDITLREAFQFYAFVKQYMQERGKLVAARENVLDFGCGWGRIIRFFLKDLEGSRLWGVDCYAAVLEAARQTNRWCRFEQIDPMPPMLADSKFDLIYCFSVFSHVSEGAHERWLVEFHRLLKPGGMFFATTRGRDFIEYCARLRDEQRSRICSHSYWVLPSRSLTPRSAFRITTTGSFVIALWVAEASSTNHFSVKRLSLKHMSWIVGRSTSSLWITFLIEVYALRILLSLKKQARTQQLADQFGLFRIPRQVRFCVRRLARELHAFHNTLELSGRKNLLL